MLLLFLCQDHAAEDIAAGPPRPHLQRSLDEAAGPYYHRRREVRILAAIYLAGAGQESSALLGAAACSPVSFVGQGRSTGRRGAR